MCIYGIIDKKYKNSQLNLEIASQLNNAQNQGKKTLKESGNEQILPADLLNVQYDQMLETVPKSKLNPLTLCGLSYETMLVVDVVLHYLAAYPDQRFFSKFHCGFSC